MVLRRPAPTSWLFPAVFALAQSILLLATPSFPTVDGPSHAYSARVFAERLTGSTAYDGIVVDGNLWNPNTLGYFVLALLRTIPNSDGGERLFVCITSTVLVFGSWRLALAFKVRDRIALALLLPLTVNFLLVMGFNNFLLGLGIGYMAIAQCMNTGIRRPRDMISISLFLLLVLWSHALAFVLIVLTGGSLLLGQAFLSSTPDPSATGTNLLSRPWMRFGLLSIPGTLLVLMFNQGQQSEWGASTPSVNLDSLLDLRVLTLYDKSEEHSFRFFLKLVLIGIFIGDSISRFRSRSTMPIWRDHDAVLLAAAPMGVLYLVAPDSAGYASYISLRVQFALLILLFLWAALALPKHYYTTALGVVMVLFVLDRISYVREKVGPLADVVVKIRDAGQHLPAGSVVLPASSEKNWLLAHADIGLGVSSACVLLENNAFNMPYFPLVWDKSMPWPLYEHLHLKQYERSFVWLREHMDQQRSPRITHVALTGWVVDSTDTRMASLLGLLKERSSLVYANGYVRIHELTTHYAAISASDTSGSVAPRLP